MSAFPFLSNNPHELDCGGFPRSARATYKDRTGTVLWLSEKKWIFYDSKGKWYADDEDNPDKKFGDPGAEEYPETGFISGISRCLGNVFDEDKTWDLKAENVERHRFGRKTWPEVRRGRPDQREQDKTHKYLTKRVAMNMERGGRSRRNIKKNKSKKRRSRKTIRRRRR